MSMLFAIDPKTEEIIISDSPKGSNEIIFLYLLYNELILFSKSFKLSSDISL